MKCPHCKQEHPEGTKFCPETGQRMMLCCPNKGCINHNQFVIPIYYKFCPECGTSLLSTNKMDSSQDTDGHKKSMETGTYDRIHSFYDGMAVVQKGKKYGYIDKFGIEVIECEYDYAGNFSEGLAYVHYGRKKMFIDRKGEVAFLLDDCFDLYGLSGGFCEGLCKVGQNFGDENSCDEDDIIKTGFVDRFGDLVIDCQFGGASNFCNGRALVWDIEDDDYNGKAINYRFIDVYGDEVIGSFYQASEFCDGYAVVREEKRPKNYKTWIIDTNGKTVRKIDTHDSLEYSSYDNCGLHEDIFLYSYHKWIDLVTGMEHELNPQNNLSISKYGFFEGLAAVQDSQGEWGFMNVDGDVIINCQFDNEYAPAFSEGLACVKQNGLWGFIDKTGKVVIPYQYAEESIFREGRAVVRKNDTLMVIDENGNRIL